MIKMSARFYLLCGFLLLASWIQANDSAPAKSSLQVLSPRPGWIPVFIRRGDTPLEDINPELAEAFRHIKPKIFQKDSYLDNSVIPLKSENDNEIIKDD